MQISISFVTSLYNTPDMVGIMQRCSVQSEQCDRATWWWKS